MSGHEKEFKKTETGNFAEERMLREEFEYLQQSIVGEIFSTIFLEKRLSLKDIEIFSAVSNQFDSWYKNNRHWEERYLGVGKDKPRIGLNWNFTIKDEDYRHTRWEFSQVSCEVARDTKGTMQGLMFNTNPGTIIPPDETSIKEALQKGLHNPKTGSKEIFHYGGC